MTNLIAPFERLEKFKKKNDTEYEACCPAHDDDNPSLSIGIGKEGKIILRCHAGCSVNSIVGKMGLKMADLFPKSHTYTNGSRRSIVATYDYKDADGTVIYQVVRFEPKSFAQRSPDGKGGWAWSMKGVKRVLYRLPELRDREAEPVYVVEGEKDVDRLMSLGILATTCAQGAGKWQSSFSQALGRRDVVILPDNDEPGRNHAIDIAKSLHGHGCNVRIVELPGLPDKGDVSDWLNDGGTVEELQAMADGGAFFAPVEENAVEIPLDALVSFDPSDVGNAMSVLHLYPNTFSWNETLGWMVRTETHHESRGAEQMLDLAIEDTLLRRRHAAVDAQREEIIRATKQSNANVNNTKARIKAHIYTPLETFDSDPWLLNCANGVVDLRTGDLLTSEPSTKFTYCITTEYKPDTDYSQWRKFLDDTIGNHEQIAAWFQMAVGYSLTGSTREEIMFYLYGPARSGKGTFTNAILGLLGTPLAKGINFSVFAKTRGGSDQNFDLAPLRPCRFVAASESGKYQNLNEAVIKQITGSDQIYCAHKNKDMFSFTPQFKIWLSSNHKPAGDVDDDAFWGRVKVVEFPYSHLGNEDKTLKTTICSEEYRAQILAWAIEGAMWWAMDDKGLITPQSVQTATQSAREELDSVGKWLEECCYTGGPIRTTNEILINSYEIWCKDNGFMPKHAVHFGRALEQKGFAKVQIKKNGIKRNGREGIAILAEENGNEGIDLVVHGTQ